MCFIVSFSYRTTVFVSLLCCELCRQEIWDHIWNVTFDEYFKCNIYLWTSGFNKGKSKSWMFNSCLAPILYNREWAPVALQMVLDCSSHNPCWLCLMGLKPTTYGGPRIKHPCYRVSWTGKHSKYCLLGSDCACVWGIVGQLLLFLACYIQPPSHVALHSHDCLAMNWVGNTHHLTTNCWSFSCSHHTPWSKE